jgi:hypothetical protein
MTTRSKIWLTVAVLFTVINGVGAVLAGLAGQALHAGTHVVLTLVGVYYTQRIWSRSHPATLLAAAADDRLSQLERSVDAVAIEVERIGEGQRFMNKVMTETKPPGETDPRRGS